MKRTTLINVDIPLNFPSLPAMIPYSRHDYQYSPPILPHIPVHLHYTDHGSGLPDVIFRRPRDKSRSAFPRGSVRERAGV
jgi:hypothetical protein